MIREILTEWRPTVHTKPMNWPKKAEWRSRYDGQVDNAVQARVVRIERDDPDKVDEIGNPVKHSSLGIEHKVTSETDSHVFLIKEHDRQGYEWARKRFAYQFEELEGKTLGRSATTTSLLTAGIVPEGVLPSFLKEGVTSVEALAYLSDQAGRKFGPNFTQYRQRALDHLNRNQAAVSEADLDARIQKAMLATQAAVAARVETEGEAAVQPAPAKPGRPRKEAEAA